MSQFIDTLVGIFTSSGFAQLGEPGGWLYAVMICVGCFLLYLAIVKEFEPLILLPMAFGMILANLPGSGIIPLVPSKHKSNIFPHNPDRHMSTKLQFMNLRNLRRYYKAVNHLIITLFTNNK